MLIHQYRIAVGIDNDETGGAGGGLVGFDFEGNVLLLELALKIADIGERFKRFGGTIPAGIERKDVLLEHSMKQADRRAAVLQNQPVLRRLATDHLKTKLLL